MLGGMESDWPHAPPHRFEPDGCYMVTAATLHRAMLFKEAADRDLLRELVFRLAQDYRLRLHAWAILPNHYHLVIQDAGIGIRGFLAHLHRKVAVQLNGRHGTPRRKVIYQFWDTQLTFEKSWLARMHYVNQNPVKHGLVAEASMYPWCSARWFESNASPAFIDTLKRFKIDRLNVPDDF